MVLSATDGCLLSPRQYCRETSMLDIGRGYIRYAIRNQRVLVFRLVKDETTSTGFKLNYRLAFEEPYLAISHSWTDRTGHGNSLTVDDLAPWPITLSPAKIHLLDWLFEVQAQGEPWTSWYWMDLFCIDQTREDENTFSQQLEQIPSIFFRANSCLALLASRPCREAVQFWGKEQLIAETKEYEHWDAVVGWLKEHSLRCFCSPTLDSWLTRVWTRQEVLYSKDLIMVPATVWLGGSSKAFNHRWESKPDFFSIPHGDGGIRELASMLVTWDAKYQNTHKNMPSSRIAKAVKQLLCGAAARFSQPMNNSGGNWQHEPPLEWHAFNWTMIVDGSIRYTSHTRDAILSQMLLIPGYRVPQEPWSMPLPELIADSCFQYRQLLRRSQLAPMIPGVRSLPNGNNVLAPKMSDLFEQASICELLQSVGSPCDLPAQFRGLDPQDGRVAQSSLIAYQTADMPQYEVTSVLSLEERPQELAAFVLSLSKIWADAEGCRTTWNMRACLQDIKMHNTDSSNDSSTAHLKKSLRHFVGRLTHTSPFSLSNVSRDSDRKVRYCDHELRDVEVPDLLGLELTHCAASMPKYTSLAFGRLSVGEKGNVWGLGQDKTTKLAFGVIADRRQDGALKIRASGVLMTNVDRNIGELLATATDFEFGPVIP